MQIAVSTASLADDSAAALRRAAALGFTHVEATLLTAELDGRRQPAAPFFRALRQLADGSGLTVWSAAAPQPTAAQLFAPQARLELLQQSLGAAALLGARVLVLEPIHLYTAEDALEAYLRAGGAPPVLPGFDELWAQAATRRVALALTNIGYRPGAPLTEPLPRLEQAAEDLAIGWALDLARAERRSPLGDWLARSSGRLAVAYAADGARLPAPSAEWAARRALPAQTPLKCLVLHGRADQSDAAFAQARAWWSGAGAEEVDG